MPKPSDTMKEQGFDAEYLARLAEAQCPHLRWLPAALRRLRDGVWESEDRAYLWFVSPAEAKQLGLKRMFADDVVLVDDEEDYILDILTGYTIVGIEFYSRIPGPASPSVAGPKSDVIEDR